MYGLTLWGKKLTPAMVIFDILVLWYYSFGGSVFLRPFVEIFWVLSVIAGIFIFKLRTISLNKYSIQIFFLIVYLLIVSLFSIEPITSYKYVLSFILYFVIAFEITSCYENVKVFLKIAFVYSCILMVISFIQKLSPPIFLATFLPLLPSVHYSSILSFMANGSVTGFFNQTSSNAMAMSLGIAYCLYNIKRKESLINYILFFCFFIALGFTSRRGSFIMIVLILAYDVLIEKGITKKTICFLIGLVLICFGSYIPGISNIINKFTVMISSGDISNGRFDIWGKSLVIFIDKPIIGHGIDTYSLMNEIAHNSYIQALVELGVVGFIFYFTPIFYGLWITLKNKKRLAEFNDENTGIYFFSLTWQLYFLGISLFESAFSSELSIFILFFSQLAVINLLSYGQENCIGRIERNINNTKIDEKISECINLIK